jgi:hypothetical protein
MANNFQHCLGMVTNTTQVPIQGEWEWPRDTLYAAPEWEKFAQIKQVFTTVMEPVMIRAWVKWDNSKYISVRLT